MSNFKDITEFLKNYDGKPVTFMEVCGTHTSSIAKNGIKSMLSDKIRLVSGPGCPVCVTVSEYIDKLCELSLQNGNTVVTFGDMIRVPGSKGSLYDARANGGSVEMVYSPFDILQLAENNKDTMFIFAAIGFETTTPIYAIILEKIIEKDIKNIKLLTSIKTMPNAIKWICDQNNKLTGFIAPGHVCAITGYKIFEPLAKQYKLPFVVSGFEGEQILASIYTLIKSENKGEVYNLYRSVVTREGNLQAENAIHKFFTPDEASWRGLGKIPGSGLYLKNEYKKYDAGSYGLENDVNLNTNCRCGQVLIGEIEPKDCPLFGKACIPENPRGACMVSLEGSCYSSYIYGQK